jgi:KaiC/GvpD/RAD55 family RecA-like ATPase
MSSAAESLPRKMWNDTVAGAANVFTLVKRSLAVKAGLSLLGAGALGYTWWHNRPAVVAGNVLQTFESGGRPGWGEEFTDDAAADIKRLDVEAQLAELFFRPGRAGYVLIMGEHGTGKSTAVRRVVRNREGINGAVYVNVPDDLKKFGDAVSEAVGFTTETVDAEGGARRRINATTKEERTPKPSEEPMATWSAVSDSIKAAAIKFHDKHGRPAVLVIDSVELIAKEAPEFLTKLQNFAKQRTDSGTLRVVFISSDGSVLKQLKSQSAWSRALKPPFEVGDIPDADAVEFLKGKGVAEEQAAEAVRVITGGRFALLTDYVAAYNAMGNKAAAAELFNAVEEQLSERVKLPRDHALFRALVEKGVVDAKAANALVSEDTRSALLAENILAAHYPRTKAYTFHSRYVETFFKGVFGVEGEKREGGTGADAAVKQGG